MDDVELLWGDLFQILFAVWPTLSEQKWIIFRERRRFGDNTASETIWLYENEFYEPIRHP